MYLYLQRLIARQIYYHAGEVHPFLIRLEAVKNRARTEH